MTQIVFVLPDGREVLMDLMWETGQQPYGRAEARTLTKGAGAHSLLLRVNGRNLGMSKARVGKIPAVSLAASLADRLDPNWCGVFKVRDGFAFVAVSDKCVLPDGDRFYASEDEAKARLLQERFLYEQVFCPRSWEQENTQDSQEILSRLDWSRATSFEPLDKKTSSSRSLVLLGVCALALAFAGYESWQTFKAREAQKAQAAMPHAVPAIDPWLMKPLPIDAVQSCLTVYGRLSSASRQGWRLSALTCDFNIHTVAATLTSFSTLSVQPVLPPTLAFSFTNDGQSLAVNGPLNEARVDRHGERPRPADALAAQNFLTGMGKPNWQDAGRRLQFDLTTTTPISVVGAGIQAYPTASIDRLDLTEGETWHVHGDIYH